MKKTGILFVLLLCISLLAAMNVWETASKVYESSSISSNQACVEMPNGVVYVWAESRNEVRKLYVQYFNENGQKLWADSGLLLAESSQHQSNPSIIKADDNSVIIAWAGYSMQSNRTFYMQKLDMNGQLLWGNTGIELPEQSNEYAQAKIFSDNMGGAIYLSDGNDGIYLKHISSSGNQISQYRLPVTSYCYDLVCLANDGYYFAYNDGSHSRLLKLNLNGETVWDIAVFSEMFTGNLLLPAANGDLFYIVKTNINTIAQKINPQGEILWTQNKVLHSNRSIQPKIQKDENQYVMLFNDYLVLDTAKYDEDLNLLWGPVSTVSSNIMNVSILLSDNHNIYLYWIRDFDSIPDQMYNQVINSSGQALYGNEGRFLTEFTSYPVLTAKKVGNKHSLINCLNEGKIDVHFMDTVNNQLVSETPVNLIQGHNGYAEVIKLFSYNNQHYVFSYRYSYVSGYQYFLQIYDAEGVEISPENGIAISPLTDIVYYGDCAVKMDPQGNFIFSWVALENGLQRVKFQKISPQGELIYLPNGLLILSANDMNVDYMTIEFGTAENDYYFYFKARDGNNLSGYIVGQRVYQDNVMWGPQGKTLIKKSTIDEFDPANIECQMYSDGTMGNVFFWREGSLNVSPAIRYLMIDSEGNPIQGIDPQGVLLFELPETTYISGLKLLKLQDKTLVFFSNNISNNIDMWSSKLYYAIIDETGQLLAPATELLTQEGIWMYSIEWNGKVILYFDDYSSNLFKLQYHLTENGLTADAGFPQFIHSNLISNFNYHYPISMHNRTLCLIIDDSSVNMTVFNENVFPMGGLSEIASSDINEINGIQCCKIDNQSALLAWRYNYNCYEEDFTQGWNLQKVSTTDYTETQDIVSQESRIVLNQNYPNPFNPSTKISYQLKDAGNAELNIYNVKGQKVKTLVNEYLPAGNHEIVWNGLDSNGNQVSSGIYFYKLSTSLSTQVKKMVLMK
jgi:hypothetical protein